MEDKMIEKKDEVVNTDKTIKRLMFKFVLWSALFVLLKYPLTIIFYLMAIALVVFTCTLNFLSGIILAQVIIFGTVFCKRIYRFIMTGAPSDERRYREKREKTKKQYFDFLKRHHMYFEGLDREMDDSLNKILKL